MFVGSLPSQSALCLPLGEPAAALAEAALLVSANEEGAIVAEVDILVSR